MTSIKEYKSLGHACDDLNARLIKRSGYKNELEQWVQVALLGSKQQTDKFYNLETQDGIWSTNVSEHGLNAIAPPTYVETGKTTNDFYNFITKYKLKYDSYINVVENTGEIVHEQIKISNYLKLLPEV